MKQISTVPNSLHHLEMRDHLGSLKLAQVVVGPALDAAIIPDALPDDVCV
jgi:hypothetical protein